MTLQTLRHSQSCPQGHEFAGHALQSRLEHPPRIALGLGRITGAVPRCLGMGCVIGGPSRTCTCTPFLATALKAAAYLYFAMGPELETGKGIEPLCAVLQTAG